MTDIFDGDRKGAGSPKLGVDVRKIALYPSQWQWLNEQAKLHGITRNELSRHIIDLHIQNINKGSK